MRSMRQLPTLGTALFIPPHVAGEARAIKLMLPQFGLPGQDRFIYREPPFTSTASICWTLQTAQTDDTSDGTDGNEASLMSFAALSVAPDATLIGLRGRSTEEGSAPLFRPVLGR